MLWSCFSAAGTEGLIRVEEKLNAPNYRPFHRAHAPGPKFTSGLCLFIGLVSGGGYKRS